MISKQCKNCGEYFDSPSNSRKYCSFQCYCKYISENPHKGCFKKGHASWNAGMKGYRSGEQNNKWKGGRIEKPCEQCGSIMKFYPSDNKKYCSRDCHNKSMIGQEGWNKGKPNYSMRGKNHPKWTGKGRHDIERKRVEAKVWRRKVFDRDDYTCRWCGVRGIYLNAHHIKTWKNHPKERYILENGITLCPPCHKKTYRREEEYQQFFQELLKKAVNSGKPLTDNAEGNPEPSPDSNDREGATTRSKSQVDDNSPKSAAPERDDIV